MKRRSFLRAFVAAAFLPFVDINFASAFEEPGNPKTIVLEYGGKTRVFHRIQDAWDAVPMKVTGPVTLHLPPGNFDADAVVKPPKHLDDVTIQGTVGLRGQPLTSLREKRMVPR